MEDGHDMDRWDHTAFLATLLFNPHREPNTKPKKFADFHPVLISKKKRALKKSSKPAALLLPLLTGESFVVGVNTPWVKAQTTSSLAGQ